MFYNTNIIVFALMVIARTCEVNPPDGQCEIYVRPVEAATDGASQPDIDVDDGDHLSVVEGGDDDKPEDDGDADEDLESGLEGDDPTDGARQALGGRRHRTFTTFLSSRS